MKTVIVGAGITLPAFSVPSSDPLYWISLAAYEDCLLYERMYAEGFTLTQIENDDLTGAETLFSGMSEGLSSWMDSAISAANNGEEIPALDDNYIPELIELLFLIVTGNYGAIFFLFVKVGFKFLVNWLRKHLPKDSSIDESAQTLENIFLDKTDPENVRNHIVELCELLQLATASVNINIGPESVDSVDSESGIYIAT